MMQSDLPTREDRLQAFFSRFDTVEVEWGVDECTMFAAQWVGEEAGLTVPRTAFSGEAQGRAILRNEGGLANVVASRLQEIGLQQTFMPELGDVGVLETSRHGQIGVIFCAYGAVAWRMSRGVRFFMPRRDTVACAYAVPSRYQA